MTSTLAAPAARRDAIGCSRFSWTSLESGGLLANGQLMSAGEALALIRASAPNGYAFVEIAPDRISYVPACGYSTVVYSGRRPVPADAHRAMDALLDGLAHRAWTSAHEQRLIEALRAAVDHRDPTSALLQLLACPLADSEPDDGPVTVDCPACAGLRFASTADQQEAAFLAGLHNDLTHAGAPVATLVPATDTDASTEQAVTQ